MKAQLNQNSSAQQAGEIALFRSMLNILNGNGNKTVFCEETHRHLVSFFDSHFRTVSCEISDLLLISLDEKTLNARISFLQAKRKMGCILAPNYQFDADFRQLYLLTQRPYISSKEFPLNILRFSTAKSLTTYGVFYNDANGVDFFYTAAGCLQKKSVSNIRGAVVQQPSYQLQLPLMDYYNFGGQRYDEMIVIDGADAFENSLIAWEIGAVLPPTMGHLLRYVFNVVLSRLRNKLSVSAADDIDDVRVSISNLESLAEEFRIGPVFDSPWFAESSHLPSIAIVQCDSERSMD